MANKIQQNYFNPVSENLEKLAKLFPTAVKDGQFDIEALKEELGDFEKASTERYELTWPGKKNAKQIALTDADVIGRTLKYCPGEGVDEDKTENLYIEGDNLEVLKLLRNSYYGKIKMIYIDPPYNTGNDFVYRDKFKAAAVETEKAEGERDEYGERLVVNQKSSARFHSSWFSMMYPRLRIAKDFLREDGVIFISIDDNELENLKLICNEIFDNNNFEGHIHWRRRHNQPNDKTKMLGLVAEHVLVYSLDKLALRKAGVGKIDLTGDFSNPDNDPRGEWASKPWKVGSDQSGSRYIITTPKGVLLDEEWMGDEDTFIKLKNDNRIVYPRNGDGMPRKKYFRSEREEEGQCATNWWEHDQFGHNQGANDSMTELFGVKNVFSNPKPVELIRGFLQVSNSKENDIILDFFSGSATTAHAVMQLNAEDGGNRKYIMVQYPEETPKNSVARDLGYNTISEIGKKRIHLASAKIKKELHEKQNGQQSMLNNEETVDPESLDLGFKVFKAGDTNINWNANNLAKVFSGGQQKIKPGESQINLADLADDKDKMDFVPGAKDIDVVYEILLRHRDFPLSSPIEKLESIGERTYMFTDAVVVCFESSITNQIIDDVAALMPKPIKVIFRDSAFDDNISLKLNAMNRLDAQLQKYHGGENKAFRVEFI